VASGIPKGNVLIPLMSDDTVLLKGLTVEVAAVGNNRHARAGQLALGFFGQTHAISSRTRCGARCAIRGDAPAIARDSARTAGTSGAHSGGTSSARTRHRCGTAPCLRGSPAYHCAAEACRNSHARCASAPALRNRTRMRSLVPTSQKQRTARAQRDRTE